MNEKALERIKTTLLLMKTWRYLRYIHARAGLLLAPDVKSVLVIGAGHGIAEIALAVEFPRIKFVLTDYDRAKHSSEKAKKLIQDLKLTNVTFDTLNILRPHFRPRSFDMVYSVEVLEHIQDDTLAAKNMRLLSSKYVFTLVPFADAAANSDNVKRQHAWDTHEHYVVGYDTARMIELFPDPISIRGVYWRNAGQKFRKELTVMTPDAIKAASQALKQRAAEDIISERLPVSLSDALGIWSLSRPAF